MLIEIKKRCVTIDHIREIELGQEYAKQVSLLYETYFKDAEALHDAVWHLQEFLVDPFLDLFGRKEASKRATDG